MQFFIDSQGTVVNLISSPVYQNSTNANELVVVAPFSSTNVVVANFRLPNGMTTGPYLMTIQRPLIIDGKVHNIWRVLLDGTITEYAGKVTVQFEIHQGGYNANDEYKPIVIGSYSSTFSVQKGVTPNISNMSPTNNFEQNILNYLTQLNPQYNVEQILYSTDSQYAIPLNSQTTKELSLIPDTLRPNPSNVVPEGDMKPGVGFSAANINPPSEGMTKAPFYALNVNVDEDTGFTIEFAEKQDIGKMQFDISRAYYLTELQVKVLRGEDGEEVEELVDDFKILTSDTTTAIINVNKTKVKSFSLIQPYNENVAIDNQDDTITNKGFTQGRFYIESIQAWMPNSDGQITIKSSTGRRVVFPDVDVDAQVSQAEQAMEQAQGYAQNASNSANQATSALDEILSKAGQVGGYPILADIDGQPKIPSVYIQQVDIKDYIQITSESELATINAQVGDVAVLVSTVDGETTVTKSWILLSITDNTRNWAVYGTSYASNAGNALFSQNSADSQKVNGLTINGILSEADYNSLSSKQGVYFVSIEGETNGN